MPSETRDAALHRRALARQGADAMRLAAAETLKTIAASQGWLGLTSEEGVVHPGDPARNVDHEAHETFERTLFGHPGIPNLKVSQVFGEEKPPPIDGVELMPGHRVVLLDPLDGSTQWAMVRAGYCVASAMLVADASGRRNLESAIIATPVHTFTYLSGEPPILDLTFARAREPIAISSCLPASLLQEPSMALTGYKIKDRRSVAEMMNEFDGWAFLTIGGNPVTPYVFAGDLCAAVTLRAQSTWDAIGILMALETDAAVGTIDGNLWRTEQDRDNFRAYFDSLLFEGSTRPIPPIIVAKNTDFYEELVSGIARVKERVGSRFGSGLEELS